MPLAIGVKFRRNGPLAYFTPDPPDATDATEGTRLAIGDRVVADTARGPEIGEVVMAAAEVADALLPAELRPVLRRATSDDERTRVELDERGPDQVRQAKERVHAHKLDMKIVAATTSFDGQRILFDFSAEGRVDFRELARDLAGVFHCRVELRQIYPRDEARLQDGYGPCGRRLCCSSWLKEFAPVSIKHAKEQGLPLNPAKLNGMCGKLKCCLVYENDQYVELKARLPRQGSTIDLEEGEGRVKDIDVPRELVLVQLVETGAVLRIPAERLALAEPRGGGGGGGDGDGGRRGGKRRRRRGPGEGGPERTDTAPGGTGAEGAGADDVRPDPSDTSTEA